MVKNLFLVVGTAANQKTTFAITDTKLYVPVVTFSTQNNIKLLDELKSSQKKPQKHIFRVSN